MKLRLVSLKDCKDYHTSKHSRRASKLSGKAEVAPQFLTKNSRDQLDAQYDPLRHYENTCLVGVPSHFTMPTVNAYNEVLKVTVATVRSRSLMKAASATRRPS
jgi:hypothetical protein